jgi:acetate kinase
MAPGKIIMEKTSHILTLNSGSSSVKFALFAIGQDQTCLFRGSLEGIGSSDSSFQVQGGKDDRLQEWPVSLPDHRAALQALFAWLEEAHPRGLDAVGHRIVHGGSDFFQPHRITPDLLARLDGLIPLAPDHLPHEIKAIHAVSQDFPDVSQIACFDTAFHRPLPRKARLFALPRGLESQGVRRYGFHGLSCEYILQELEKEAGTQTAQGRVVIAHLGGGASMTAVYNGQSMETTMGLTPLGGLVMGTRCGDLDPGVLLYLMRTHHLSVDALDNLLNRQSGLLGVSGIDSDMKELLRQEKQDSHAAEAIELFCYQAKKFLGALSSALGGLDTLVFTGGIGENAQVIRERICQDMEFLGIHLDVSANQANAAVISAADSPATVRVIKTDEERMIARHCAALIGHHS